MIHVFLGFEVHGVHWVQRWVPGSMVLWFYGSRFYGSGSTRTMNLEPKNPALNSVHPVNPANRERQIFNASICLSMSSTRTRIC
jgi:hypothetical protein